MAKHRKYWPKNRLYYSIKRGEEDAKRTLHAVVVSLVPRFVVKAC